MSKCTFLQMSSHHKRASWFSWTGCLIMWSRLPFPQKSEPLDLSWSLPTWAVLGWYVLFNSFSSVLLFDLIQVTILSRVNQIKSYCIIEQIIVFSPLSEIQTVPSRMINGTASVISFLRLKWRNAHFSFLKHYLFEGTEESIVKDCQEKHLLYIFIFEFLSLRWVYLP